ncbi:MAG: sodium:proton exchanger [Anaerolineae bacterium]|nr:MAG: sodium:proton exchanger [Anaerolineae bacterium]
MHEVNLLVNITVALTVAFCGGLVARRLGMPTIVGYLVAGVLIGPFTPGFVGDTEAISELAEIGVIFLMFGVGIHFSFRDLWSVRDIAIPGAVLQMVLATGAGLLLSQFWGWSIGSGLVLGLAISIASTVVLLRGLMDQGLLNTTHGRVAVGWLILEDIATVLILVLLPALSPASQENTANTILPAIVKAGLFIGVMVFAGVRVVPWILLRIAKIESRELFILTVLVIALGTALAAAEFFGVSLALGAFLAGVVVSESALGHQAGAEVLPFQQIFAVLFFVSVGMLVNPAYLLANAGPVLVLTGFIVLGKSLVTALLGFIFPHPARTILVVAAGLSQIGEFSFIVGRAGLALNLLNQEQYSLILAGALLSIMVNPLMFRAVPHIEKLLQRAPSIWRRLNHQREINLAVAEKLAGHVVVLGYGRVGQYIVNVLGHLNIPRLVVEMDAAKVAELERADVPVLMGDAANSELLNHAGLEHARALVVTLPEEAAAEIVVSTVHKLRPTLPIIVRASTQSGVSRLVQLGAHDVIHPELEGGLEIMRHTLLRLNFAPNEVQWYADAVRRDQYDSSISTVEEHRVLDQMITAAKGMEIAWLPIPEESPIVGKTIAEANLRALTGASIVAMLREGHLIANPKSATQFHGGDIVGVIGESIQVQQARGVILSGELEDIL